MNGFVNSSSAGIVFVPLDEFEGRASHELSADAIAGRLQQKFGAIEEAFIAIFPPPPVNGLGTTGGFKLQIEDRANMGYQALDNAVKEVVGKAYAAPELTGVYSNYNISVPQ